MEVYDEYFILHLGRQSVTVVTATSTPEIPAYEYDMGPRDILRVEGETDEFIPCPYVGGFEVTWVINGIEYSSYHLPDCCISYAFGLLIKEVKLSLNNTSFRCRYSTGRGFETKSSSVGVLTVVTTD